MKRIAYFLLTVFLGVQLTSCSSIMMSGNVRVNSTEDAKVYVNGSYQGQSGQKVRVKRLAITRQSIELEIKKEGHKSRTEVIYPRGFNFWFFGSLPFLITGLGLEGAIGYHKNLPRKVEFPLTAYPSLSDSSLSLRFNRIRLDTSNLQGVYKEFTNPKKLDERNQNDFHIIEDIDYYRDFEEGYSLERMNDFLFESGLRKRKDLGLGNFDDYNLTADVEKFSINECDTYRSRGIISMDLDIRFKVITNKGAVVVDTLISGKSGNFVKGLGWNYPFFDAFDYATLKLLEHPMLLGNINNRLIPSFGETWSYDAVSKNETKQIDLKKIKMNSYLLDSDLGTAICLPVKKEGILAVSSYALENSDSLVIMDQDSVYYEYRVEFKDLENEIAFIKINKTFDEVFPVKSLSDPNPGNYNVNVVGIDSYFDAFRTSRGVINAVRLDNGNEFFQIDASCNNQICPIVLNDQGEIIGVVSKSLSGAKVGGVSFCSSLN